MTSFSALLQLTLPQLLNELWNSDSIFYQLLRESADVIETRNKIFAYIDSYERRYYNIFSDESRTDAHIIDRDCAKECIRVLKNVLRTENERLTQFSALETLMQSAQGNEEVIATTGKGFYCEFIRLLQGINLTTGNYMFKYSPERISTSEIRSDRIDKYASLLADASSQFKKGTDPDIISNQEEIKAAFLRASGATEQMWTDYRWQIRNLITDRTTIEQFVKLEPDEAAGLDKAKEYRIPVQITPYYLSLFNKSGRTKHDRTVRAQVIPSTDYCNQIHTSRLKGESHDYMDEQSCSPIAGITRRYPQIVILKPFDSCPQICVYCQRNWEITGINDAVISREKIKNAITWISENELINEVIVTGGDPLTLDNKYLDWIISSLASISHIDRIRIGTRTLVTIPFRFNNELLSIFEKHHRWGSKEIAIMTHCEHPLEITPDVLNAVQRIKRVGINIYNQQVFTYYNSHRFETSYLRKICKLSGLDPYYSFNTKGKEETIDFRVPIARIEQERKEEARLLPGLVRTDEPVFNVPRLGKSHLRAWQDHEPIMINPDGSRVYRFFPWESRHSHEDAYLYTDVPIYNYLLRLHNDGDNPDDYESIWYYF
ncbi:MAG: KamA family radical SAM protein [Chitinispirillaceae bacterium]|nr:KamA family radical SAM protein [Chitinispirillaceae bacterium]